MDQSSRTYQELWDLVEPVVTQEGLELYDIERSSPSSAGGRSIIRVYLSRPKTEGVSVDEGSEGSVDAGVTVDDCATVSRKLSALDRFDQFLGEHSLLEVSSPGINRKLRTLQHFTAALGERVRVKAYNDSEGRDRTITGFVLGVNAEELVELKDESSGEVREIPFANISSARIDFDFSTPDKKGNRQ
jgi:ribosome maturation factor RimP